MYLSKSKILFSNIISTVIVLISGFFLFIGLIGFFMEVFTFSEAVTRWEIIDAKESLAVAIGILIFFGVTMIIGIKRFRLTAKARKFNSIFENDSDGIILVSSISRVFGKSDALFMSLFDKLVKKGYLVNCYIAIDDVPKIILANGKINVSERFATLNCSNCGATNSVRVGFVEKCKYCGSEIKLEK